MNLDRIELYQLLVDGYEDKWFICWPDLTKFSGPYKTASAAKAELTKIKKLI